MRRLISLAASVTWIAALVIAVAMLAYAVFQYASMPDMTFWQLLVMHSWHVIALGGLTYVVLHFLLHKQVVEPLQLLYLKLYAVARGDNEPITIQLEELATVLERFEARVQNLGDEIS